MATKPAAPAKPPAVRNPNAGAVVQWQKRLEEEAAAGAASESVASEFVSFASGILTFNGQQIANNELDVIVIDAAYEHAFYGDYVDGVASLWPYDADQPKSPNCYAFGRTEDDLAPIQEGDDAPELIVHTDCASCPLNEWKSDPEGGKGKACKNVRRLALMDANVLKANHPDAVKAATVVFAKLPVTSVKNWSAFVIQMANVVKRPPYGVIAKMKVVRDQRTQFQVQWEYVDNVPDELIPAMMEKKDKLADSILFTYPKNSEREEQAPAAPARPVPQKHAPKKPVAKK